MKILMIIPHGLNAQSLGCYGNESLSTPALDRLAAEGIVFHQHYADHPDGSCRCQFFFCDRQMNHTTSPIQDRDSDIARVAATDLQVELPDEARSQCAARIGITPDWEASRPKLIHEVMKLIDGLSGT